METVVEVDQDGEEGQRRTYGPGISQYDKKGEAAEASEEPQQWQLWTLAIMINNKDNTS